MKKYLVSVEGNYGSPDGGFNWHGIVEEPNLKNKVREALIPYLENWNDEDKTEEELIENTIKNSNFSFMNTGYGEELFIEIEEV